MRSRPHTNRGFTIIELMIVVAIIGLLMALLLPALSSALRNARAAHDKSVLKGIGMATANSAEDFGDRYIRPSLVARCHYWRRSKNYGYVPGKGLEGEPWDSTESLYSVLIMKDYLMPDTVVSPVDTNAYLLAKGGDGSTPYDYNAWFPGDPSLKVQDEPTGYWDTTFSCQLDDEEYDNASYANQTLVGRRAAKKWRGGATTIIPMYSTRGTTGEADDSTFESHLAGDGGVASHDDPGYKYSPTLEHVGPTNSWNGHVYTSDGKVAVVDDYLHFKHYAGGESSGGYLAPQPDNMFECEFLEWVPDEGSTGTYGHGNHDNFLAYTHNNNQEQSWSGTAKFCFGAPGSGSPPAAWAWYNDNIFLSRHLTYDYQGEDP
ncbi:MAG: prepilin-type N-terminal cleavage/methylation domain-containing protein [Phycisphaerales bacterium]|nr:prepilin-type N-terminal cleavage/methylation domain-containing protein [Phycisphaerales bacterium]